MTHPEDLKPNDWIALVEDKYALTSQWDGYREVPVQKYGMHGVPLRVLAVSYPFISIQGLGSTVKESLDLRQWAVQKLSTKYVKSLTDSDTILTSSGSIKKKPASKVCPVCEAPMVERLRNSAWYLTCKECKFEGARP